MLEARGRLSADDWGLSPSINEAILELARDGMLHSVSVIANLPYLQYEVDNLLATGVKISAHLNFTLGKPILPAVRSLSTRRGNFRPFARFFLRGIFGLTRAQQVEDEAFAQIKRLQELFPVHSANSHEHVHALPWMTAPVARACQKAGVKKLRRMVDPVHFPSSFMARWSRAALEEVWPGLEWEPTAYLFPTGAFGAKEIQRRLLDDLEKLPLLVHPASRDDFCSLEFSDSLRSQRVKEYFSLRELKAR